MEKFLQAKEFKHKHFSPTQILEIVYHRILNGISRKTACLVNPFLTKHFLIKVENFLLSQLPEIKISRINDQNLDVVGCFVDWGVGFNILKKWRTDQYKGKDMWSPIQIKVFVDNRIISGRKNEIFAISFVDSIIEDYHSWKYILPVGMMNVKESSSSIQSFFICSQFISHWAQFHSENPGSSLVFVNDWIASICFFDVNKPFVTSEESNLCFKCHFSGKDKTKKWREMEPATQSKPLPFFGSLPNVAFYYDPMHGLSRLLTYCLQQLLEFLRTVALEKQARTALEILVSVGFSTISGFNCKGMKFFFKNHVWREIINAIQPELLARNTTIDWGDTGETRNLSSADLPIIRLAILAIL